VRFHRRKEGLGWLESLLRKVFGQRFLSLTIDGHEFKEVKK
jgi:hypothetical protein